jgi:hypothetical protein
MMMMFDVVVVCSVDAQCWCSIVAAVQVPLVCLDQRVKYANRRAAVRGAAFPSPHSGFVLPCVVCAHVAASLVVVDVCLNNVIAMCVSDVGWMLQFNQGFDMPDALTAHRKKRATEYLFTIMFFAFMCLLVVA